MKILKYKFKDSEHFIKYINSQKDEVEIRSSDDALPDLANSIKLLEPFVHDICEIPHENGITVSGISISRNEDSQGNEIIGAVIVAQKKLLRSTGIINIVTPHRIEAFYSEHGDEGQLMPDDMIEAILEIEFRVKDFIQGKRAQQELFPQAENAA